MKNEEPVIFRHGPYPNANPTNRFDNDAMFGIYARQYHLAGKVLLHDLLSKPHIHDIGVCPIIFLYRHAVELYLKSIVRFGRRFSIMSSVEVEISDRTLMTSHLLSSFLPAVRQTFEAAGWIWNSDIDGLRTHSDFEDRIKEFEKIDPGSYSFRYPIGTKGEASIPSDFSMSIEVFSDNADALIELLDTAVFGLSTEIDHIEDCYFDFMRFYSA